MCDPVGEPTRGCPPSAATGDPLAEHVPPGTPAGVRLVDPRRRNRPRLNGRRATVKAGLELSTAEVFRGCPNAIPQRSFERSVADEGAERAAGLTSGNALRWSPEGRSPVGR